MSDLASSQASNDQSDSQSSSQSNSQSYPTFPVVGIGASAGGIEAVTALIREIPDDLGLAFVVVQHLSADSPSMLSQILGRVTSLSVTKITEPLEIEPDCIYVIAPNTQIMIAENRLQIVPREGAPRPFMPIDTFFRSLADNRKHQAIGIILSGLDSDGALGCQLIKEQGGITFTQTQATAQYSDMPHSAIQTGCVDFVLSPDKIIKKLINIASSAYFVSLDPALLKLNQPRNESAETSEIDIETAEKTPSQTALEQIHALLRSAFGIDFSQYKPPTFERRLQRRIALNQLSSKEEYLEYLQREPDEVGSLYQDVLITVTSFFRDFETFAFLKASAFPLLIENKLKDTPIRMWIAGCATGEECYSLAICLLEYLAEHNLHPLIQIFGTDVNEAAISTARLGIYSESQLADVSPERRDRFFVRTDGSYRVSPAVRELCVFARQDLGSDPPFSNIDFISCRNVMIYFSRALQKQVLSVFHYSLNPNGLLLLGSSESIGETSTLFTTVDQTHKIYRRSLTAGHLNLDFVGEYPAMTARIAPLRSPLETISYSTLQRQVDQIVLNRYAPVGVIINDQLEILHFRGNTSPYLRPAPGEPTFQLLRMVQPSLLFELRSAIEQCRAQGTAARRERLQVENSACYIHIEVTPIRKISRQEPCYLVLFEESEASPTATKPATDLTDRSASDDPLSPSISSEIAQLELELAAARQELLDTQAYLQTTIEDQNATNQRLTTANEEILSSNEELRSTNEELQTAKEEIQAANEELQTTNEELQSRNADTKLTNDDLLNFLDNVNIPVVILSSNLCIRRFTPAAQQLFNLILTDVGRPISNIRWDIEVSDLEASVLEVMRTLDAHEREVQDSAGRWYQLRIRPYRTADHQIDGAVITLVDINDIKQMLQQLDASRCYAESIVETVSNPLLVLDDKLHIKTANRSFYQTFRVAAGEIDNISLFDLNHEIEPGQWDRADLRSHLEATLTGTGNLKNFEMECSFIRTGLKTLLLNAREIQPSSEGKIILISIEDITERKQAETERIQLAQAQAARLEAEAANAGKDRFLSMLSHELRTPLNAILGWASVLLRQLESSSTDSSTDSSTGSSAQTSSVSIATATLDRALHIIERSARTQTRLIDDLLDVSRIVQGRISIQLRALNLTHLLRATVDAIQPVAQAKSIQLHISLADAPSPVNLDPERMQQVFWNALSNAVKFTPNGGRISVTLTYSTDQATVEITDTGNGIDDDFLPFVFDRFRQANESNVRQYGGLGLGLAIVKELVEAHRGSVEISSPGVGEGTTLTMRLPLLTTESLPEPAAILAPSGNGLLNNLTILAVEDDADSLEVLTLMLTLQGSAIATATSVSEAKAKLIESDLPQLIISDISLPDQTGFDLIQWIRALPPEQGGSLPAIALTGYAAQDDKLQITAAGFQRHLVKPVNIDDLIATILELTQI